MAQSSSGARLSGPSRGPRVATGTSVWGRWEIGGTLGGGAGGNGHRNTSDMLNLLGLWESNRSTDATIDVIVGISALVCLVSTLSYCILLWGHGERGAKPGEDLWSWTLAAPWRRDWGQRPPRLSLSHQGAMEIASRRSWGIAPEALPLAALPVCGNPSDLMEVTETWSCELFIRASADN